MIGSELGRKNTHREGLTQGTRQRIPRQLPWDIDKNIIPEQWRKGARVQKAEAVQVTCSGNQCSLNQKLMTIVKKIKIPKHLDILKHAFR